MLYIFLIQISLLCIFRNSFVFIFQFIHMHSFSTVVQNTNFVQNVSFPPSPTIFDFTVLHPVFSSVAGRMILNNTVMMSNQCKLYAAAIWNSENKSFIYTVLWNNKLYCSSLSSVSIVNSGNTPCVPFYSVSYRITKICLWQSYQWILK